MLGIYVLTQLQSHINSITITTHIIGAPLPIFFLYWWHRPSWVCEINMLLDASTHWLPRDNQRHREQQTLL